MKAYIFLVLSGLLARSGTALAYWAWLKTAKTQCAVQRISRPVRLTTCWWPTREVSKQAVEFSSGANAQNAHWRHFDSTRRPVYVRKNRGMLFEMDQLDRLADRRNPELMSGSEQRQIGGVKRFGVFEVEGIHQ